MYNRSVQPVFDSEPPRSLAQEPGPFRVEDYRALPDEPRCELLWGHLVVTPSPLARHQRLVVALVGRLREFALREDHELLVAPMDVTLFEHTVVQPDLLLVSGERRSIVDPWVEGPPDLAIEVLSPSTGRRDRVIKLALYARAGVPEYWIVDPDARTIDFLLLEEGSYRVVMVEGDRHRSARFPGLELDLRGFWAEIGRVETGRLPGEAPGSTS